MDEAEELAAEAIAGGVGGAPFNEKTYPELLKRTSASIRAYGEACRRAGAEAMREAAMEAAACTGAPIDTDAAIRRAFHALPSAAEAASPAAGWRVPDGWKLVPITPTDAMIEAGWIDKEDVDPDNIYCAMLDAAPPPSEEARAG